MTRTFNKESYATLLAQYQPKIIETEEENEAAIQMAESLEHRNRTLEEDTLLELLVTLIEKFEEEHYPLPEGYPRSMLLHLMEAQSITQDDLVAVFGSRGGVSEILNGKQSISKAQAQALGEFFHVSPELFI